MSVISGFGSAVGAAGEPFGLAAVILAELLGEVVVPVDQRRRLEDAVDPRLDLGVDRLARKRRRAERQRRRGGAWCDFMAWV